MNKGKKGKNPNAPAPVIVTGRLTPDPVLQNIDVNVYSTRMTLSFDPLANVECYTLYYEQDPQPANITNGVTIDGVWHRQVTSCYPTLPMYVNWGWSPMYLNATYKCRVGVYYTDGNYSYSEPFTVNTSL